MNDITPNTSGAHSTRYVEYTDIFADSSIKPSASIPGSLLLFDTFQGVNLLQHLYYKEEYKMYQKVCIYIIRGEAILEINSKKHKLTSNMLITIMPENMTRMSYASTDLQYFMLVLYPKLSNQIYNDIGVTYSNAKLSLQHFISPLAADQTLRMLNLYNDIKFEIQGKDYELKESYIHCLLQALVVENINIHKYNPMPLQGGDSSSRQYDVYCHFLSLLNKHAGEQRSVFFYAKQLGISSKYLSYVCISYSKKNASTWIGEAVIQKAKALMVVHNYSLTETCQTLHFPTVSSFSRFFKRVTGITPKAFVKLQEKQ